MSTTFSRLLGFGLLPREDARIAEALARRIGADDDEALLALCLALRAPLHGHVCFPLDTPFASLRELSDEARAALAWAGEARVTTRLLDSGLARRADDVNGAPRPLVIDDGRLYLARHHADELAIAAFVKARASNFEPLSDDDARRLRDTLDALFAEHALSATATQKRAVATAFLRRFAIITGGPGTGKTTTVVRLLALLASRDDKPLRIALLAPTGKAAARLAESVRAQRASLPVAEAVRARIPVEAKTIHRTLGTSYDGRTFKHDATAPLPVDVVVVDEASMVDLPLMARLFAAIPDHARVILLGDRDQLSSVEAGAVLADLTGERGVTTPLSAPFAAALGKLVDVAPERVGTRTRTSLADAVVELETSHRFDPARGIGRLAAAIHAGDVSLALETLRTSNEAVRHAPDARDVIPLSLRTPLVAHASALGTRTDDRDALGALDRSRVLCAVRRGLTGVEAMNQRFTRWVEAEGHVVPRAGLYAGLPILITRNDPTLDLSNGDIGLVREQHDGGLRALFQGEGDAIRAFAPGRLPPWDPVHAMTVHKSQGSEVDEVVLVLPEIPGPIVTRELLYTAITRARHRVHVIGSEAVIERAIRERVIRATGLRARVGL